MRFITFFLLLLFCQPRTAISQTVIQMQKEGGVSVIPCKVNGLKLSFVFDTGASDVSMSMTEALFMLKNGYLSEADIKGTNKYSDATGSISEGIVINLREIDIAGIKLYNVAASIVKNADAPLLLGQSAIRKLGKCQLDFAANTLTISEGKNTGLQSPSQKNTAKGNDSPEDAPRNIAISPVVGNPKKIGNLEVAEHDFPFTMTWEEAKKACARLGEGWRLPTKDELNDLYLHKGDIGGFAAAYYWSSSEYDNGYVLFQSFSSGRQNKYVKNSTYYVRAVRAF